MKRIKTFVAVVMSCLPLVSMAAMPPELVPLSERWAAIKYQMPERQREQALEGLAAEAESLAKSEPGRAEPLVWQAIIVSTLAGEKGGLGGLSLAKQAKRLLERAEAMNPDALDGSIYTSLGSLYYQVPGWPIGFGDDDKARGYLEKALALSPDGIDANYFYGDFLLHNSEYRPAVEAFEKALQAPPREQRPVADAGRRKEAATALAKAREHLE